MRMRIPITGTVKQIDPCIIGDEKDGIRPINIDLGNVSWKLIHLDLENEEMEIEVKPATHIKVGEIMRETTPTEKAQLIEYALDHSLSRMSKQALYALSKSPALKNPFKEESE